MDKVLTKAVWKMRQIDNYEQGQEVNVAFIPTGGNTYQMYFPGRGCRYSCIMCNYGFMHPIREKEILNDLNEICENLPTDVSNIILEASGSFLDEAELPEILQFEIMRRIAKTDIPIIQIETHYTTATERKIIQIKDVFQGKEIVLEFGLESTNPEVIKIYNKNMDLAQLLDTIWMCSRNGIGVSLNLLLGAPLLTVEEQIKDTVDSVKWILRNCPKNTSIVLFPLNIKNYTLVKHMYNQGRYEVVYDWAFIEVLRSIPKEELGRVYISWWGNRCNEFHGEQAIIKPFHCDECQCKLMAFYKKFVESKSSGEKAKLISEITSVNCRCREVFERKRKCKKSDASYLERLEAEKKLLVKELNL